LFDRKPIEAGYLKAIELDANFPEPHTGLALLAAQVDWNWAAAERELNIASVIAPSAMAEGHYALIDVVRGRKAEAAEHIRRARDLDPLGVAVLMNTAELQIMAGEYETPRAMLDRFSEQHPEVDNARFWAAISLVFQGRGDEALARFRLLDGKIAETEIFEAAAHAVAGRRAEALRLLHSYESRPDRSEANIAQVYGFLHDEANTLTWLDRSVTRREPGIVYLAVHPAFAFLHENLKFRELERRVGVAP
jgi:tetratricopeptide (TPR) repeat protein